MYFLQAAALLFSNLSWPTLAEIGCTLTVFDRKPVQS